ncbi:MAG: myo-inosose-2 dehydratase [Gammaproteobacteria bacterium]|nr:myo-inosose-2 dehydratase [Gammaproteobacteria bacterium]
MNVSIGVNPIIWSNDDLPHLGAEISLETCLADAAAARYAGIELGGKFPRDPERLAPLLESHGLSLVSGWYGAHLLLRDAQEEAAELQGHLDLLKRMGCKVLVFAEVTSCTHAESDIGVSRRPRMKRSEWALFADRVGELARMTADQGVKLAYHHHVGTVVQSAADIERLLETTPDDLWLLLDTGHALYAGADPVAVAQTCGGRIAHVHCKDVRRAILDRCLNNDSSFPAAVLDGVFTVPGDGCVDFKTVLSVLRRAAYEGWLVVEAEQDPSVAPPARYANLGYENLQRIIASI